MLSLHFMDPGSFAKVRLSAFPLLHKVEKGVRGMRKLK